MNKNILQDTLSGSSLFETENIDHNNKKLNQLGGGFFDWLFGNKETNNANFNLDELLDEIADGNIEGCVNKHFGDNKTLLHIIVENYSSNERVRKAFDYIFNNIQGSTKCVKSIIDEKDNNGDTALHIAVKHNLDNVVSVLICNGAKKGQEMRNLAGAYVSSESHYSMEQPKMEKSKEENNVEVGGSENTTEFINNLVRKYGVSNNTNDNSLIGGSNDDIFKMTEDDADDFINNLFGNNKDEPIQNTDNNFISKLMNMRGGNANLEYTVDSIGFNNSNKTNNDVNISIDSEDPDNFIRKLFSKSGVAETMQGGRKSRSLNMYTDNSKPSVPKSSNYELSRVVDNQSTKIHEKVVKDIQKLMKVDEETAKAYKAGLWKRVNELYPTEKSNLNKSVEMEKMTTKDELAKIDVEKIKDNIKKHFAEKEKNREKLFHFKK